MVDQSDKDFYKTISLLHRSIEQLEREKDEMIKEVTEIKEHYEETIKKFVLIVLSSMVDVVFFKIFGFIPFISKNKGTTIKYLANNVLYSSSLVGIVVFDKFVLIVLKLPTNIFIFATNSL